MSYRGKAVLREPFHFSWLSVIAMSCIVAVSDMEIMAKRIGMIG